MPLFSVPVMKRRRLPTSRIPDLLALTTTALFFCAPGPLRAASLDLLSLQVYATESIHASRSDYQGPTAAGGAIDLTDFGVDGDLTAGTALRFTRGQVRGTIRAPTASASGVFASRGRPVHRSAWEHLTAQFDSLAARLACAPATIAPTVAHGDLLGQPITILRIAAGDGLDVTDLQPRDLSSDGPNRLRVILSGNSTSRLVIRVRGDAASLQDVGFAMQGGLTPGQVVFAFPEARRLTVAASGGASGADGIAWGIPASLVAPRAELRLAAATVTGQVFARRIEPIAGMPSGQVNRLDPAETEADLPSGSSVLREISEKISSRCQIH